MEGRAAELARAGLRAEGVRGPVIDPIFLAEAAINGILLGGILALLALGLNLIFGVIDIVWIAYVDLVMLCMYAVYFLEPGLRLADLGRRAGVARPRRAPRRRRPPPDHHADPRSPPINQLLATGGLLFFIQSFATFLWTTDHRSVRLSLPSFEIGGIFLPATRLIPFGISILAMLALYLFLTRTYMGTAIRAVSQDREAMALMGANPSASTS